MGAAVTNVTQNNKKSDIKSDDARSNEMAIKVNNQWTNEETLATEAGQSDDAGNLKENQDAVSEVDLADDAEQPQSIFIK